MAESMTIFDAREIKTPAFTMSFKCEGWVIVAVALIAACCYFPKEIRPLIGVLSTATMALTRKPGKR
jgi:hypothetical protein